MKEARRRIVHRLEPASKGGHQEGPCWILGQWYTLRKGDRGRGPVHDDVAKDLPAKRLSGDGAHLVLGFGGGFPPREIDADGDHRDHDQAVYKNCGIVHGILTSFFHIRVGSTVERIEFKVSG